MNIFNVCRHLYRISVRSKTPVKYAKPLRLLASRYQSTNSSSQRLINRDEFKEALPGIIEKLVSKSRLSQIPELETYVKKILDYNLSGGNNSQGIITMFTYNMLEQPEYITEEKQNLSKVLGWCLELIHCSSCIVDDIIDDSNVRRGAPCWHLLQNVGMGAINDAILLTGCVTEILELFFTKTPHLSHILHLFHKAILYISMGQYVEAAMPQKLDYSLYTMKAYNDIVYYKTSYNSYQTPIELGLTLVTHGRKKINTETNRMYGDICFKLGKLFQMQNDYNDCYADERVIGKVGTDIEEGKCTWLSVTALEHCNEIQRERFTKCYASKHSEDVSHIRSLYDELHIPALYKQKNIEIHEDIIRSIRALPTKNESKFFYKLLDDLLSGNAVWGNTKIYINQ